MEPKNISFIHDLAKKFEESIKGVVAKKFSVLADDLYLLLSDQQGVYLSKEDPDTLCCFVVGKKNGYLYLVTAKIVEGGRNLDKFKCDIIS